MSQAPEKIEAELRSRIAELERQLVGVVRELTEERRARSVELATVESERDALLACFIDPEVEVSSETRRNGRWRSLKNPADCIDKEGRWISWADRAQAERAAIASVREYVGGDYDRARLWGAAPAR